MTRVDDVVEASGIDGTGGNCRLSQRDVAIVRLVRDGRSLVIADYRTQRSNEHQRAPDHLVDALSA